MSNIAIVVIILITIFIIVLLNVLIVRYIINRALKKFIKPTLTNNCFQFIDYKWNMIAPAIKQGFTFYTNGSSSLSIYIDVFYSDADAKKKVTVRIDTLLFFIRKVAYDKYFITKSTGE